MVSLRMKKLGRLNRPFYRIEVMDKRKARDGLSIETLGFYDPFVESGDRRLSFNAERIRYWLSKGAQPSHSVVTLLKGAGFDGFPVWVRGGGTPRPKQAGRPRKLQRKPHIKGLTDRERKKLEGRRERKVTRAKAAVRKAEASVKE